MASKRVLVIGVAVGVALLAAAYVFAVTRPDGSAPATHNDWITRGSFPEAPTQGWQVGADDVEAAAGVKFGADARFNFVIDLGDLIVTSFGSTAEPDNTRLVAIDVASGDIRWAVPTDGHMSATCATESIDGLLLCTSEYGGDTPVALREYSVADGELVDTVDVDELSRVAVSDGSVYTSGWNVDTRSAWVAKGNPADPADGWREEYPVGSCTAGIYGGSLLVTDGVVVHTDIAAAASDGRRISPEGSTPTHIGRAGVTVADCGTSMAHGPREVRLLDRDGTEILAVSAESNWPARDLTPGPDRPYVLDHTAYDVETGDEFWSTDSDAHVVWLEGDVALATVPADGDPRLAAHSLTTGERLWSTDSGSVFQFLDGSRTRAIVVDGDELVALDLASGAEEWSASIDPLARVDTVGDGFVTIADGSISYFPPTG